MFLKWLFHSFFSYFRLPTLPLPLQSQLMIFYYISLWNRSNSTEVDLPATNFPASVPTLFTFLPLNIYGVSLLLSKFFICTQHSISSNLFKDCVPGIILPCSSLNWVGCRNDLVSPPLILQLSPANTLFSFSFFWLNFLKNCLLMAIAILHEPFTIYSDWDFIPSTRFKLLLSRSWTSSKGNRQISCWQNYWLLTLSHLIQSLRNLNTFFEFFSLVFMAVHSPDVCFLFFVTSLFFLDSTLLEL